MKNLYFVCLQFNKHNSYWYKARGQYQDIQTALGAWSSSGNIIFTGPYHNPWQSVYPHIALHISNYYIIIMPCYFYLSPDNLARKIYLSDRFCVQVGWVRHGQHAHRIFHLEVHVPFYLHFWGSNVPSNSSFGGTKKMSCILLISHVQFLCFFLLSIWNKISICCCFECIIWML